MIICALQYFSNVFLTSAGLRLHFKIPIRQTTNIITKYSSNGNPICSIFVKKNPESRITILHSLGFNVSAFHKRMVPYKEAMY